MPKPSKERIKEVMDEVDAMDLNDFAHWMVCHEKLGLEYGDLFPLLRKDAEFFGIKKVEG